MTAEMFRLVWTREGDTFAGDPTTREEALRLFDGCKDIQHACSLGRGRLKVIREQDYRASEAR